MTGRVEGNRGERGGGSVRAREEGEGVGVEGNVSISI